MKKALLFAIACVAVLGLTATNVRADALLVGDGNYVGFIAGITGAVNETDEAAMLAKLITLDPDEVEISAPPPTTTTYDRRFSTLDPLPAVGGTAVPNTGGPYDSIDVTALGYLMGKYDGKNAGFYVWLVPTGSYAMPLELGPDPANPTANAHGISHYVLFNANSIPDGGVTLMLLGGALVALDTLRRKFSA
jgi:hypothetical protein